MNYKFLFASIFICLSLAFNGSLIFGQCPLDSKGAPRCIDKVKTKSKLGKRSKNRSSKSVNTSSTIVTEINKPGSIFKETLEEQSLIVKYYVTGKELIFLIEASNHFSKEKTGEIRLYVDKNRNGKIDVSDIRYKMVRNIDDYELKALYLSNKEFSSVALVEYAFGSTKNESRPHPVWKVKIPKTEILSGLGEIHIRFEYWYETCPDCILRIPEYNVTPTSNVRDNKGLLNFGPVKKLKFKP